jgi:hypothetical protein
MSRSVPPSRSPDDDYQAIEAAVMETARGRWFLSEYAKRNRAADTASILEALTKLEELAEPLEDAPDPGQLRGIIEMLADARTAPWQGNRDGTGQPGHQRPQQAAESAVSAVRRTADKIREVAFELRETAQLEIYANALDLYCADLTSAALLEETAIRRLSELAVLAATIESQLSKLLGEPDPIKESKPRTMPKPAPASTASESKKTTTAPEPAASDQTKVETSATNSATLAPTAAEPAPALADPVPPAQPEKSGQPTSASAQEPSKADSAAQVLMFINPA